GSNAGFDSNSTAACALAAPCSGRPVKQEYPAAVKARGSRGMAAALAGSTISSTQLTVSKSCTETPIIVAWAAMSVAVSMALRSAPSGEQAESPIETVPHIDRGHRDHSRRRQLDPECNSIEACADLDHRFGGLAVGHFESRIDRASTLGEQRGRRRREAAVER